MIAISSENLEVMGDANVGERGTVRYQGGLFNWQSFLRFGIFLGALVLMGIGLVGATIYAPISAEARDRVHWQTNLDSGLKSAKKQNKYVLADVYTDWCGWCKRLDKDTFSDARVVSYLNSKFVCVKINAEGSDDNRRVAQKYNVHGYPCALVFNTHGKFIGRLSGYLDADQYPAALEERINSPQAQ